MFFLAPVAVPVVGIAAITKFYLMGKSLSRYDRDIPDSFTPDPNSKGALEVRDYLIENFIKPAQGSGSQAEKLSAKRARFERVGRNRKFDAKFVDDVVKIDGKCVPGQWTLIKDHDPDRRLLYLHGGAFTVGSPVSHRAITTNLAQRTGCAVFAPDYRLMPENPRMASIEDARASYKWILDNGPNGPATAKALAVGGDSAGGNLTLMLSNWVRDEALRAANAVFAISPSTDSTAESPSIRANLETDLMLKPLVTPLTKIPRWVFLWLSWRINRIPPASPLVSPVRDDLSGLPPTLIHVSSAELLYDDAVRYVSKAEAAGSPVRLQSWAHMCHVWHIFDEMLPEAHQALDEIAEFMRSQGVACP